MALLGSLVVAAALAIFVYQAGQFWPQTLDDAFITFRYAQNLAAGHGPVWNPGLPPAEGYTTFLWMLILVIPHALGADPVLFAKVLGVAAALGCVAVTYAFGRALCEPERPARAIVPAAAVLFLCAFYPTSTHAVSGMETALFTLLAQGFFFTLVLVRDDPTGRRLCAAAVTTLFLGLTRPDGVLLAVVGLGVLWWQLEPPDRRRAAGWGAAVVALPWSAYFVWRFLYYGHPLPLTFYVKVGGGEGLEGLPSVLGFLRFVALPLGILVVLGWNRQRARVHAPLAAAFALLGFYLVPLHVMGVEFRFCAPVYPLFATLAAAGLPPLVDRVAPRLGEGARGRHRAFAAIALTLCPLVAFGLQRQSRGAANWARGYAKRMEDTHIALGRKLATLRAEHPSAVLAINDAGAVPYYSGWETIDTVGLNEPHIALSGEHDPAYVLSHEPDLVVVPSITPRVLLAPHDWQRALYEACEEHGMQKVRGIGGAYYHLWLIARPDSWVAEALRGWDFEPRHRKSAPPTRAGRAEGPG